MFTKFAKRLVKARKRSLAKSANSHQSSDDAIEGDGVAYLRNSGDSENECPKTEESAFNKTDGRNTETTVTSELLGINNAEPMIIASWVVKLKHMDEMVYLAMKSPNGYERGLVLNEILGATDDSGELCFVVNWGQGGVGDVELVPASIVNEKSPQEVIEYYEKHLIINENAQEL